MPDIEYAFLADAAEAQPGQKFAVLGGGVSRIGGTQFPLRHPHLAMVVGLLLTTPELGAEHDLRFAVLGPEGAEISSAAARIRADGPHDGNDAVLTFSLDLWNLTFPAPGSYSIRILVDGSERKRLPLVVAHQEPASDEELEPGITPPFPPPTGQA
jgi:uncharacterized protein DUF6941